jgi:hypothetical protein
MMISLLVDAVTAVIKTVDRCCTEDRTVVYPEHGIQFDPQRGWMTHE